MTTWSNTYGWGTDNFIEAEYIDSTGTIQHLSDKDIPNPYASEQGLLSLSLIPSVIITKLTLKLHEILDDEQAVFVPFTTLPEALDFAHELAKRNIGISLAVLSRKYLTEFISPTHAIAEDFNYIAEKYLKLNYIVDVICDTQSKKIVEELAEVSFGQAMVKSLILGSSKLASMKDSSLLKMISEEENPLKAVFGGPLRKHFEEGLASSPQELAKVFPEDLREFFEKLYSKPELTDPVWLHSFRILPCRMERKHMWMYRGGYMPGDKKTMRDRLIEDHLRAQRLADRLANIPGLVLDPGTPHTNMILLSLADRVRVEASEVAARLAQSGVRVGAIGPRRFRLVTHFWIDDSGVERAAAAFEQVMQGTMI